MTGSHPSSDDLLDLALASPTGPRRGQLAAHLDGCEACRREYTEIAAAVDQVVVAAPLAEPPPGLDHRILSAMRAGPAPLPAPDRRPDRRPGRRTVWALVASAAVVGALAGAGAVALAPAAPPAAAPVVTDDGARVGSVTVSRLDGRDVLVVAVDRARPGATYGCRVVLADGSTRTVGEWTVGADDDVSTWAVPLTDPVVTVELVGPSGAVWATADM